MKKRLLFTTLFVIALCSQGQVVNIPDPKFKAALLENGIDANNNGQIEASEAESIKYLSLYGSAISDLTGIEAFTSLDSLDCSSNNLTVLNVTQNHKLTWLCCYHNDLVGIDLSQNKELTYFNCYGNEIKSLDLSHNPLLAYLFTEGNKMQVLDISQNKRIILLVSYFSPSLQKICIDPVHVPLTGSWQKDAAASYSTSCSQVTGLEESVLSTVERVPVRIVTSLGTELKPGQEVAGSVYIYQYSNGSRRKVLR